MGLFYINRQKNDMLRALRSKVYADACKVADSIGGRNIIADINDADKTAKLLLNGFIKVSSKDCVLVSADEDKKIIDYLVKLRALKHYKLVAVAPLEKECDKESLKLCDKVISLGENQAMIVYDFLMDEQMGEKCDDNVTVNRTLLENGAAGGKKWKVGSLRHAATEFNVLQYGEIERHVFTVSDKSSGHGVVMAGGLVEIDKMTIDNGVIYERPISYSCLPLEISEKCHFGTVSDDSLFDGSVFLASAVPIIVTEDSPLADFVKNNNCGLVVQDTIKEAKDSLKVADILGRMTMEEYDAMLSGAKSVAQKLRRGDYLKACFEEVIYGQH